MGENDFIKIGHLFDTIGIIEKGIEKIYHHLLKNKKIENLKAVCNQYGLTLKRGYKICSVLNDLELVQIFDRPMKIHLVPDLIPFWQRLVIKHIEELQDSFLEKKKCEIALEEFFQAYNIKEVVQSQEPVEFISFSVENFEDMYYHLTDESACKIAIGIRYENPLISLIQGKSFEEIPENIKEVITKGMMKLQESILNKDIQVIFHNDLVNILLKSMKFQILSQHLELRDPPLEFKSINIHITKEPFSNFSLTDNELIQPSFDPTNKLLGSYISTNKNIYQIFNNKFDELYNKGISINEYIQQEKGLTIAPLSKTQFLALCLL